MVKVSVIIPTYHRAECVCRAIDSVLAQTLKDIEIIVVDDNGINTESGKQTADMMKRYKDTKNIIYLRHDVNKNGAAARNTGIRHATGEYISFLDDDDIYLPERLELMTKCLDEKGADYGACYTAYIKHMRNGKIQRSQEKVEDDVYVRALMRSFYHGSGSNLFYRKSAVDDIGLFDESFLRNQDLEYNLRILEKYKVAYVDEPLMEIFFDFRTVSFTYQQSFDREMSFRKSFQSHIDKLSPIDKRNVEAMYDIDWTRYLVSHRHYKRAFKNICKSKIPLIVWIKYMIYLLDRYAHNTSYSFVPNIQKKY